MSSHPRFSEQDVENVRRGFAADHGRYIALMDLSQLLSNDTVESQLPSAEVVLHRPLPELGPLHPSMVEIPNTVANMDLESLSSPSPPIPRMMKNLLKDRRRFHRQFVSASSTAHSHDYDEEIVARAHRAMENFQLKEMFKQEQDEPRPETEKEFCKELLFASIINPPDV
ncbi:PREDICTED: uncharacterized protein LOC108564705 [Nicrophorus vespilloides]|uniref:Uncharacterized protein LOC108564705 n=1 Tax=Nicrophorus vespilloides TaxID=110193 RepID=A0ABM1MXJ0_NICVS|nr:PREDICTED: uncharacterized protein LOC108564705 [Nicrophorus vespilloides]